MTIYSKNNLSLFLVLACGALRIVESASICPLQVIFYQDNNCIDITKDPSAIDSNASTFISLNNQSCQFIDDALYKVSCDSNTKVVTLSPCNESPYIKNKSYSINACYSTSTANEPSSITKSFKFYGDCTSLDSANDNIDPTCIFVYPPTSAPTQKATPIPPIDTVELQLPLPQNKFADQFLNVNLAHEIVYLAGVLIYQMDESNAESLLPDGYTFHLYEDTGSTEVLILSTEHTAESVGKIMVLFRGTDDSADGDWLTNIDGVKTRFGPENEYLEVILEQKSLFGDVESCSLRVHRGFNNVFSGGLYGTVLNVVEGLLDRKMNDGTDNLYYDKTIHFGGHSLGGANAQIFGTYFAHFHPNVRTYVTTLGAPRQGNFVYKIFVESLQNLSVWRIVNCRDIVPRVPQFGFYHAGHVMWHRCNPPSSSEHDIDNNVSEAYYRDSGDINQNYAGLPLDFIVFQYENRIISDHYGAVYFEWLEYAKSAFDIGTGTNWTTTFETLSVSTE